MTGNERRPATRSGADDQSTGQAIEHQHSPELDRHLRTRTLDPDTTALVDELSRIRADISALKVRDSEIRATLIEQIGTDVLGVDASGTPRIKITHRTRRLLDHVALRDAEPELAEAFTKMVATDYVRVGP